MEDRYGRNINYLRISVTDLCNLRCKYCMPEGGVYKIKHENIITLEQIQTIAEQFVMLGINKIRLTGGEPLVRKGIVRLVENLSSLDGLNELAMTTNAILLKKYARQLKNAGLNRVNISLDTFNEQKYKEITRGGRLKDVIEGIEEAKKVGLSPIKLNIVLIGGFNDNEIEDFVNLTTEEEIDVRFIELMPMGQTVDWDKDKFISNDIVLEKIKGLQKIKRQDPSSPASYYKLPGAKGKVGLINPISCKFCDACNRIRLTSQGKLKLCLHSNEEIDLKPSLKDKDNLRKLLIESINRKPKEHNLEKGDYIDKNMVQIGG